MRVIPAAIALLSVFVAASVITTPAAACGAVIRVTYYESSPDFFRIEFLQGKGFALDRLSIDMRPSRGSVVIDTPYGNSGPANGPGISVVAATGWVSGSQNFSVRFRNFQALETFSLQVDLDDRAVGGDHDQDHLNGSEIQGALAQAELIGPNGEKLTVAGDFDDKGKARLGNRACA